MSQPHDTHDLSHSRPSLSIDWEVYAAMLEERDLTRDQQRELFETLWSIVVMFVDLGFDLHPVQQICGEPDDALSDDPPGIVDLIKRDWVQEQTRKEARRQEEIKRQR